MTIKNGNEKEWIDSRGLGKCLTGSSPKFSNLKVHQVPMEGSLKHRFLDAFWRLEV